MEGDMAQLRPIDASWAAQPTGLAWKASGPWRVAEVPRGVRYFVEVSGPFEAVAWCEPRDRGAGRYRVDIGVFRTAAEACAACELDAQRRLRGEGPARESRHPSPARLRLALRGPLELARLPPRPTYSRGCG